MSKIKVMNLAALVGAAVASTSSHAADGTAAYFAAIDLSGVATSVGAAGVTIVGIAMAYKGITLAKRAVSKA